MKPGRTSRQSQRDYAALFGLRTPLIARLTFNVSQEMSRSPERVRYDALAARVGEIFHYVWDPIGVATVPQARDEYDGYVPLIVQMLLERKRKEEIARHLYRIESENMGLTVGSRPSDHHEEVAEALIEHYEWLQQKG